MPRKGHVPLCYICQAFRSTFGSIPILVPDLFFSDSIAVIVKPNVFGMMMSVKELA